MLETGKRPDRRLVRGPQSKPLLPSEKRNVLGAEFTGGFTRWKLPSCHVCKERQQTVHIHSVCTNTEMVSGEIP